MQSDDLVRAARVAEEKGFSSVWLNESGFYRGAFSCAALIAEATSKVEIGIGVVSPTTRNPVIIAMESATLDEISGGRLLLGLGSSHNVAKSLGIYPTGETRLRTLVLTMKESFDIIRQLLAGDSLRYKGEIYRIGLERDLALSNVKLGFQPARHKIPLFMGAMSERMLDLSGRIADGVLLTMMSPPAYVKYAAARIANSARESGNSTKLEVMPYVLLSVAEDSMYAKDLIRALVATYLVKLPKFVLSKSDANYDEVSHIISEVKSDSSKVGPNAREVVSDEVVDSFAVAGTPDECRDKLRAFLSSGATGMIFVLPPNSDYSKTISIIGEEILAD